MEILSALQNYKSSGMKSLILSMLVAYYISFILHFNCTKRPPSLSRGCPHCEGHSVCPPVKLWKCMHFSFYIKKSGTFKIFFLPSLLYYVCKSIEAIHNINMNLKGTTVLYSAKVCIHCTNMLSCQYSHTKPQRSFFCYTRWKLSEMHFQPSTNVFFSFFSLL